MVARRRGAVNAAGTPPARSALALLGGPTPSTQVNSQESGSIWPGAQDRGLYFTDIRQRVVAFRRGRLASALSC